MPWAVGNDAVTEPAGRVQAAAVPMCVVAAIPVRVMVVFDYARWKEQDAELTEIRRVFQASLPGVSVAVRVVGSREPRKSSGSGSTCSRVSPAVPCRTRARRTRDGLWLLSSLRLDAVRSIDDASIRGMLDEPSRPLWDHEGLCVCGKWTYPFSRCPACVEKEAVHVSVEIAEREPEPPLEGDLEAHEVGLEVNLVLSTLDRTGGLLRVRSCTIQQWAVGFTQPLPMAC